MIKLQITVTAKIKIKPTPEQIVLLQQTLGAYRDGCNFVSSLVFGTRELVQARLHKLTYESLRNDYSLRSQMAQSVTKTVIARYRTIVSSKQSWVKVVFKKPEYDLVWNRDYSLTAGMFSVNTLVGRVKVPFEAAHMEQYFNGDWSFGTAKLVYKHGKFYLHISVTKEIESLPTKSVNKVVGIDFGVNFTATAYDSKGKTTFFKGRPVKDKRAHYKHLRKKLQQKGTPSARRKLKQIGQRETRWMSDVNHQVSKALIDRYGKGTLFVIEDLTGVRHATERVRVRDRYETVSWAFYQLRQMLEYKVVLHGAKVVALNPAYTSQTCPKCGHTERANRDKRKHVFCCRNCQYRSNDDRIGAMNLWRKGIECIAKVTAEA